jgi:uncharacterized protein (TIGR02453 family)
MKYFNKGFADFYTQLELNNNKDWFHSNKKTYETDVKTPMVQLVTDLVSELQKHDSSIDVDPKKCIGRINRDIRFSKDKTPYKIRSMVQISKGTKNDPVPVIAFRIGARDAGIMSGFYTPDKDRINTIRNKIKADVETFQKLYLDRAFQKHFGSIRGEKMKRIAPEYKDIHDKEPLVANKQLYYVAELDPDIIFTDDFLPRLIDYYKVARPLNDFLW